MVITASSPTRASQAAAASALGHQLGGMGLLGARAEGASGAGGTSKLETVDEGGLDDYWAAAGAGFGRGPQPPEELVCRITNELMKDPVRAADGRLYEKEAI